MKCAILLAAFVAICLFQFAAADDSETQWTTWKTKYNKEYTSPKEEASRKAIFVDNYSKVKAHNDRFAVGKESHKKSLSPYSDLTTEEFNKGHMGVIIPG